MSLIIDQTKSKFFMNKQTTNETQNDTMPLYMVVKLIGNEYSFLSSQCYNGFIEARDEAIRCAELNPSHSGGFAVLKTLAIYKADITVNETIL
jgi:hypothetical protein